MKLFFVTESEARLLVRQNKNDNNMVFLRLLGRQPPCTYEFTGIGYSNACFTDKTGADIASIRVVQTKIPLRYPSGEYGVKEAWKYMPNKKIGYRVSPDETCRHGNFILIGGFWHSPVAMPSSAIRWTIKVETTVKRVKELSIKEISTILGVIYTKDLEANNIVMDVTRRMFADHWNKLHKPIRKDDGWVTYPYDEESFKRWYCLDSKGRHLSKKHGESKMEQYWKGKSLAIHANPWVEVIAVVEKIPRKGAD